MNARERTEARRRAENTRRLGCLLESITALARRVTDEDDRPLPDALDTAYLALKPIYLSRLGQV